MDEDKDEQEERKHVMEEDEEEEDEDEDEDEDESVEDNEEGWLAEEKEVEAENIGTQEKKKRKKEFSVPADPSFGSILTNRTCRIPPVSVFSVKYPTSSSITYKSFRNAVDFHPKERSHCKNSWHRDVKSTHIRNEHLLDLPRRLPKCCADIYNMNIDRKKLKKLQKYGLRRPVRTMTSDLEPEKVERCIPELETGETKITYFPECYILPESSSDDEEEEEEGYDVCMSDSISECSGCSTLGGGTRRRMHKVIKKGWRELLHKSELEQCKDAIVEEITKHKLGRDFPLKLSKLP